MIKIAVTDELLNIINVYKHPIITSGLAMELKLPLFVSYKKDYVIVPATYFLDEKNFMFAIAKMEVDDPHADDDEFDGDEYEISFRYSLEPMTFKLEEELYPFNLVHLLECVYRYA